MITRALPLVLAASLFVPVSATAAPTVSDRLTDPRDDVFIDSGYEQDGLSSFDLLSVTHRASASSFTAVANLAAVRSEPRRVRGGTMVERVDFAFMHRDREYALQSGKGLSSLSEGSTDTTLFLVTRSEGVPTFTPQRCAATSAVSATSIAVTVPFSCLGTGRVDWIQVDAQSLHLPDESKEPQSAGYDYLGLALLSPVTTVGADCAGKSPVKKWSTKTSKSVPKVGRTAKVSSTVLSACGKAMRAAVKYRWTVGKAVVSTRTSYKPARKDKGKKLTFRATTYKGSAAAGSRTISFGSIRK